MARDHRAGTVRGRPPVAGACPLLGRRDHARPSLVVNLLCSAHLCATTANALCFEALARIPGVRSAPDPDPAARMCAQSKDPAQERAGGGVWVRRAREGQVEAYVCAEQRTAATSLWLATYPQEPRYPQGFAQGYPQVCVEGGVKHHVAGPPAGVAITSDTSMQRPGLPAGGNDKIPATFGNLHKTAVLRARMAR